MHAEKYNCLILDDEPLAGTLLSSYVNKITSFNLVACCTQIQQAQNILLSERIHILFLDIEMPEMTGVEFLKMLPNPPLAVFTTAYSDYAITGYELGVVDYLLKPITYDRFFKTASKLLNTLKQGQFMHSSSSAPSNLEPTEENHSSTYLFVKADGRLVKVNYADIIYIESLREYASIYTKQKRIVTLQSLTRLMDALPQQKFIRIHRSYIVNIEEVDSLYGNTVVMSNQKDLPISKGKKEGFIARIKPDSLT